MYNTFWAIVVTKCMCVCKGNHIKNSHSNFVPFCLSTSTSLGIVSKQKCNICMHSPFIMFLTMLHICTYTFLRFCCTEVREYKCILWFCQGLLKIKWKALKYCWIINQAKRPLFWAWYSGWKAGWLCRAQQPTTTIPQHTSFMLLAFSCNHVWVCAFESLSTWLYSICPTFVRDVNLQYNPRGFWYQ